MTKVIYSRDHIIEYLTYGSIAGLLYGGTVWYLLSTKNYQDNWMLHLGSILFFFVILIYTIRLTRRRKDYKSTWTMLFAGHGAVLVGVAVAAVFAGILCAIYMPGAQFPNAPGGYNEHNYGVLIHIFFTAVLENFAAGGFAAVLVAYVIKPDQTKDRSVDY